jgi:hypothetical protein
MTTATISDTIKTLEQKKLFNQNLHVTDLRIDCPEHEMKV